MDTISYMKRGARASQSIDSMILAAIHGRGRPAERPADPGAPRAGRGARHPRTPRAPETDAAGRQAAGTPQGPPAGPGLDAPDLPGAGRGDGMKLGFLALPADERRLYF